MLQSVTLLLLFQLLGEVISQAFDLPIPGPVVGMALLFAALTQRWMRFEQLRDSAQNLLQHLSLLFVPAGVGVMLHVQRVADEWVPIVVALLASTVLAIAAAALTTSWLIRLLRQPRKSARAR